MLAQYARRLLARVPERALDAERAEAVDELMREAEGHEVGHGQAPRSVEHGCEVDVHHLAGAVVEQDVVQVPVTKAHHVAHHAHHRQRARVVLQRI